jgi:hypothetical protein
MVWATTAKAAAQLKPRSLMLSGGVAANSRLKEYLGEKAAEAGLGFYFPKPIFTSDNAAMIAAVGTAKLLRGETSGMEVTPIPIGGWPKNEMGKRKVQAVQASGLRRLRCDLAYPLLESDSSFLPLLKDSLVRALSVQTNRGHSQERALRRSRVRNQCDQDVRRATTSV